MTEKFTIEEERIIRRVEEDRHRSFAHKIICPVTWLDKFIATLYCSIVFILIIFFGTRSFDQFFENLLKHSYFLLWVIMFVQTMGYIGVLERIIAKLRAGVKMREKPWEE